jgi:hypothetical protein
MEIIINNPEQGIANYSPLIQWARERTSTYEGLVVQEDGISSAKADVADLRRLAKAASDYRIQIKKEHEAKIADTINQLKELTDIFNGAAEKIDVQVKAFAEHEKQAKREEIFAYWTEHVGDLDNLVSITHPNIWDEKWLNKGTSMDTIKETIDGKLAEIRDSLDTIRGMQVRHESEMIAEYLQTLDLKKAIQKRKMLEEQEARMAEIQAKKEAEKQKMQQTTPAPIQTPVSPVPQPVKQEEEISVIDLRIYVTASQKAAFRNFLRSSGIRYSSIPKNQ